jgi:hypothetical protein
MGKGFSTLMSMTGIHLRDQRSGSNSKKRFLIPPSSNTSTFVHTIFKYTSDGGDYIRRNLKQTIILLYVLLVLAILADEYMKYRNHRQIWKEEEEQRKLRDAGREGGYCDLEKQGEGIDSSDIEEEV